jgi:hypothetical protein
MTIHDKPRFLAATNRLAVALREKELDLVQMQIYFEALSDLDVELVIAASRTLEQRATWFPKTSEWRDAVEGIRRERIQAQRDWLRKAPRPLCPTCDDTSWEVLTLVEKGVPVRRVRPCACREQRRQELLGNIAVPALPAATAPADPTQWARVQALVAPLVDR